LVIPPGLLLNARENGTYWSIERLLPKHAT